MPVFSLEGGAANSENFVHVSPLTPKPRPQKSTALTPLSLRKYKRGKSLLLSPVLRWNLRLELCFACKPSFGDTQKYQFLADILRGPINYEARKCAKFRLI